MRLTKRHLLGFAIGIILTSLPAIAAGQAGQPKTVNASVVVTTSEAAQRGVLSKGAGGARSCSALI
jgi:heme/copper-type cytochrome/quinol oxidase subunit 4